MSESEPTPEVNKLPAEQVRLIDSARVLLESPHAETYPTTYKYRPTTKDEKARGFLSWMSRGKLFGDYTDEDFFERVSKKTDVRTISVRDLKEDEYTSSTWGGAVYLKQVTVRDIDSGSEIEKLLLYCEAIEERLGEGGASEYSGYKSKRVWEIDLLKPIDDNLYIAELQQDFDNSQREYGL